MARASDTAIAAAAAEVAVAAIAATAAGIAAISAVLVATATLSVRNSRAALSTVWLITGCVTSAAFGTYGIFNSSTEVLLTVV
jgi:hypothetical protein